MEKIDCPPHFRCPISMKIMKDPVTILTGVSYERKNIEKWFYTYNKKTCPATMQRLDSFDLTPNHTLRRLILAWRESLVPVSPSTSSPAPLSVKLDEMASLINTLESSPFKVSSLKKIRAILELGEDTRSYFIRSGGVEAVVRMLVSQITVPDNCDFVSFQACEEALGLLQVLPLSKEDKTFQLLSDRESMKSISIVLQRGSAEARFHAIKIYRKIAATGFDWNPLLEEDLGIDLFKSLLELVYDEIRGKASSYALEVLSEILSSSKKSRLKAIEAGAVCVLIELLQDSNRSKCEKMLLLLKLLCECAEGRMALVDHGLGIPAVSKTLMQVSNSATKLGLKIIWLVCSFHPTERVLEEMLMYGAVKKMVTWLHMEGRASGTKMKVINVFKAHGNSWRRHRCFPCDFEGLFGVNM